MGPRKVSKTDRRSLGTSNNPTPPRRPASSESDGAEEEDEIIVPGALPHYPLYRKDYFRQVDGIRVDFDFVCYDSRKMRISGYCILTHKMVPPDVEQCVPMYGPMGGIGWVYIPAKPNHGHVMFYRHSGTPTG